MNAPQTSGDLATRYNRFRTLLYGLERGTLSADEQRELWELEGEFTDPIVHPITGHPS